MTASFAKNLKTITLFLQEVEKWFLVLLISFLVGFAVLQIILRNFFSTGVVWGDDLLRHGVLWLSILGASRATAEEKHIRIDLLPRILPPRFKILTDSMCCLFSFLVCLVLFWTSWNFVQDERALGDIAFASIPFWYLELIFPVGFGVMALRFGFGFASDTIKGSEGTQR